MARIVLHRHILLNLPRHVPTKIHIPQALIARAQVQYDRTRKLVMRRPPAVDRLENMYGVPPSPTLAGRCGYNPLISPHARVIQKRGKLNPVGEVLFFNNTTPANPSSRSQKYTLLTPPS